MNTVRLKTNAKCGGCVARIGERLAEAGLNADQWSIDLTSPDKVLTVTSDLPAQRLVELVAEAGFRAEPLP